MIDIKGLEGLLEGAKNTKSMIDKSIQEVSKMRAQAEKYASKEQLAMMDKEMNKINDLKKELNGISN